MKLLSDLASKFLEGITPPNLVHHVVVVGGWRQLDSPVLSSEMSCPLCSGREHQTFLVDPAKSDEKVWMCRNLNCVASTLKNCKPAMSTLPTSFRAILWPKFCELNGMGDEHHQVRFEDVHQDEKKIDYMLKFAAKPRGLIIMRGDPGTGKTYSAMAVCELFTRRSVSCIFTTHKSMIIKWLNTFKTGENQFLNQVEHCSLLVIDDFGTSEVTPAFMSFFMDLINSRLQWTSRGTVITTNLDKEKLSEYCGHALSDRLRTGQVFLFQGKSKREPTPI